MSDNAKFCVKCGAKVVDLPLPQECPYCSAPLESGVLFCTNCGKKLSEPDNNHQEIGTAGVNERACCRIKNKSRACIALGAALAVAICVGGFIFWGPNSAWRADAHYKAACDALDELIRINWDMEEEHSDKEFSDLWLKAGKELKAAAAHGDSDVECDYGCYLNSCDSGNDGWASPVTDPKGEAIAYWRKAAANGNHRAEYYLVLFLPPESSEEKDTLLRKSLDGGDPQAIHLLADAQWQTGRKREALDNYIEAAEKVKDPRSVMQLLHFLEGGKGHNIVTQYCAEVGVIYEYGLIGDKNLPEALKWYERGGGLTQKGDSIILPLADEETWFDTGEAAERVK